jgi:hypothetical protein
MYRKYLMMVEKSKHEAEVVLTNINKTGNIGG